MGKMMEQARNRKLDKRIDKAARRQEPSPVIVVAAHGQAERDALMSRGFTVNHQDMSERGEWVRTWFMAIPREQLDA